MSSFLLDKTFRLSEDLAYSTRETSEVFGVSMKKLEKDRRLGKGVPYVKTDTGTIRYLGRDILAYLEKHRVVPGE